MKTCVTKQVSSVADVVMTCVTHSLETVTVCVTSTELLQVAWSNCGVPIYFGTYRTEVDMIIVIIESGMTHS